LKSKNEDGEPECYQLLQVNTEYPRDVETGLNIGNMMELFGHYYEYQVEQIEPDQENHDFDIGSER